MFGRLSYQYVWEVDDRASPETPRRCPTAYLDSDVPAPAQGKGKAQAAVDALVAELQSAWNRHDAEIADRHFSADVAWGSPYGVTVHGFDVLFPIHQRLKQENRGGRWARYEIDRVLPISDDVIVAHVARLAPDANGAPVRGSSDDAFSEMAMYVLVRRDDHWWLAAGQNTPIRLEGRFSDAEFRPRPTR
jgi:uncharacterized protein (TIGR02246 family)